jgi:hypothetical protein
VSGTVGAALGRARAAYALRWKRHRLLLRSIRSRNALRPVSDRTARIFPGQILGFSTVRNEITRLPHFLEHNRNLGVGHFLFVDNCSDDGTADFLADQRDVSLWRTESSYRGARFGVDWLTWLQFRYGHGHWCLTVDADELLIYPHWPQRRLPDLIRWLERKQQHAFGALMLDLYPETRLAGDPRTAPDDPLTRLRCFDAGPYRARRNARFGNLQVQGGVRERVFFTDCPDRSPTLNKLPLVRWHRRFAYRNSTHSIFPRDLNLLYDGPGDERCSGVLLHTKFLPEIVPRAVEEKRRGQHFANPEKYDAYYDAIAANPTLRHPGSVTLRDWRQLVDLGLMATGGWD